ncbi:MAG: sulfotransferase domain-containing protein [Rubrobacteraceae bacterium]
MPERKTGAMNLPARKLNALVRSGMVRSLAGMIPLYIVNEYPKSGGTWVGQMLGRALDVPFPRNRLPVLRSSIMHGHYLSPRGMKNVLVVWRDGRDVMVSWYHHCLFPNERGNGPLVEKARRDLSFEDYDDINGNLPAFIEYAFTRQQHPRFSWSEFVRGWYSRKGVVYVRYEDLRRDTPGELQRVVAGLSGRRLNPERVAEIADEFSFARQSGRQPGQEDKGSFMRKGMPGDWRNHFSLEARQVFDRYGGDELITLDYERDRSWVAGRNGGFGG